MMTDISTKQLNALPSVKFIYVSQKTHFSRFSDSFKRRVVSQNSKKKSHRVDTVH